MSTPEPHHPPRSTTAVPLPAHLVAILVLLLLTILPASAQQPADGEVASPAVSAEQRALDLVAALAGRDADRIFAALRDNLAPDFWARSTEEEWRAFAERVTDDLGGAEMVGIDITGREVSLELVRPAGPPVRVGLPYDPAAGERFTGFGVEAMTGGGAGGGFAFPPVAADPRGDRAALAAALDAFFDSVVAEHGFSGVALVAVDGEPVYETARGLASRRYEVANTPETRFDVGSINKSFTRVVVGQLLAAGELSPDDTIGDHLPDFPHPEAAEKVTVAHLLEHRSGLPELFRPDFFESSKALYTTPRSYFPLFAGQPLLFAPGSQRRYSNAGFIVLGALVEAVTGEGFPEVVAARVFRPAGMDGAGFFRSDGVEPRVATGYTVGEDGAVTGNQFHLPVVGSPAGSAFATARDLLAFDDALRDKRLLPAGWTRWYFDGEVGDEPDSFRGPGYGGGIAGGAPGVSALLEGDGRLTVIVLSNFDEPLGERLGLHLSRALGGEGG